MDTDYGLREETLWDFFWFWEVGLSLYNTKYALLDNIPMDKSIEPVANLLIFYIF